MSQIVIPSGMPITPSQAKTATNNNFVNALGIHKPEEYEQLVRSYGDQNIMLDDMIALMGGYKPSSQKSFTYTQDTWFGVFLKASTATAPTSGTTDTTFTVPADYLYSGKHSVRAGDKLKCNINEQTLLVVSVTDTQFVAQPMNGEWSFTSAQNGVAVSFFVYDTEAIEGGQTPSTFLSPRAQRISGTLSITTGAAQYTGSELTHKTWFRAVTPEGKELGWVWTYESSYQETTRFKNKKNGKYLWDAPADGDSATDGFSGNSGLIYSIETNGNVLDLQGQPIQIDDIDRLTDYNYSINGASEFSVLGGSRIVRGFSDMLAAHTAQNIGGNNFGTFSNEAEFIKLGFSGFERNNTKFAYKNFQAFNRQDLGGGEGFAYPDHALFIPMDMQKSTDASLKGQVPAMCVRYAAAPDGGYSRMFESWLTGAADGTYTDNNDSVTEHFREESGLQVFGAHRMYLAK